MALTVKRLDEGSLACGPYGGMTAKEIRWFVMGAKNRNEALNAVRMETPEWSDGLPLHEVRFSDWAGDGSAEVSCSYEFANSASSQGNGGAEGGYYDQYSRENGRTAPVMSFNCSGGTAHIVRAISQTRVYGGTTDDANGMVGWNGKTGDDAEFAGVDIPVAELSLSMTKTMKVSVATSTAFLRRVGALYGRVNANKFYGWNRGELMSLGCSFSAPLYGQENVVVTFNFRPQVGESNAVVNGMSVGPREGYEYLWSRSSTVYYNGSPSVRVDAIYKSKIIPYADFSLLGI